MRRSPKDGYIGYGKPIKFISIGITCRIINNKLVFLDIAELNHQKAGMGNLDSGWHATLNGIVRQHLVRHNPQPCAAHYLLSAFIVDWIFSKYILQLAAIRCLSLVI